MQKTFEFGDNCSRRVTIEPTSAGMWSLDVETMFPKADHPRWQRNLQIIGSRCDLWSIASLIHDAVGRTICK